VSKIDQAVDEGLKETSNALVNAGRGFWNWVNRVLGGRYALFLYDYIAMRFTSSLRHRQLAYNQMVCRFCDNPIDLMGKWRCECGYTRYGNYFGRCPNCLRHPRYLDCEACGSSMDVR
jgi:hypothetical protein